MQAEDEAPASETEEEQMSTECTIVSNRVVHFHMISGATIDVPVDEGYTLTLSRNPLTNELIEWKLEGIRAGYRVSHIALERIEGITTTSDLEELRTLK